MNERNVIVNALETLGLHMLAGDAKIQRDWNVLLRYVKIANDVALKTKREDIIETLWAVGLVH